jgi:hypothetical protein
MDVNVSMNQIVARSADDRGRITLGTEYANEDVQIAILEPTPEDR